MTVMRARGGLMPRLAKTRARKPPPRLPAAAARNGTEVQKPLARYVILRSSCRKLGTQLIRKCQQTLIETETSTMIQNLRSRTTSPRLSAQSAPFKLGRGIASAASSKPTINTVIPTTIGLANHFHD